MSGIIVRRFTISKYAVGTRIKKKISEVAFDMKKSS